eukprot:3489120-Pyramimonas_sp.AAC.1
MFQTGTPCPPRPLQERHQGPVVRGVPQVVVDHVLGGVRAAGRREPRGGSAAAAGGLLWGSEEHVDGLRGSDS